MVLAQAHPHLQYIVQDLPGTIREGELVSTRRPLRPHASQTG